MTNSHRTRESVLGRRSVAYHFARVEQRINQAVIKLTPPRPVDGHLLFSKHPHRPIRRPAAKLGVDRTVELEESW